MSTAVALAKHTTSAQALPRQLRDADLLAAGLTLTQDEIDVLEIVCDWHPPITINVLQNKLPHVEVESTVRKLVKRSLLFHYRSIYSLTRAGWTLLMAAEWWLSPRKQ